MDTKGNETVLRAVDEDQAELEEYTWRDRRRGLSDEIVLREAGILVDRPMDAASGPGLITITPPESIGPDDFVVPVPAGNAEPTWKRIACWLGAAFLVALTLLLYLVNEVARRI